MKLNASEARILDFPAPFGPVAGESGLSLSEMAGRRIGKVTVTYQGTYILDILGENNRVVETVEISRKTGLPVPQTH